MMLDKLVVKFNSAEDAWRITFNDHIKATDIEIAVSLGLSTHEYEEVIKDVDSAYLNHSGDIHFNEEEDADIALNEIKRYLRQKFIVDHMNNMYDSMKAISELVEQSGQITHDAFNQKYPFKKSFDEVVLDVKEWKEVFDKFKC